MLRAITSLGLFLSIYLAPWWFTFIFLCIGILYFELYVEGVIAALFLDWLYMPYFHFFPGWHSVPVLAICIFIISPTIKHRLLV